MMKLAQRQFAFADQLRFADASGDRNPMHIDPLQARRTQAGAPVVHGINLLLWALDSFASAHSGLPPMRSLRAEFIKFILLNELVDVVITKQEPSGAQLNLLVDGAIRSKISIAFGDESEDSPESGGPLLEPVPLATKPLDLAFEQMPGFSGSVAFQMTPEDAVAMFPSATKWLGHRRIAAIAASTYLVGMVCPGLHSIYSELSMRTCIESVSRDYLSFHVTQTDARFRLIVQEVTGGGLTGTAKCFARMPPTEQASMHSLAGLIAPEEFAGSLALIVGGSRGLGELTAKMIATGGGQVIITWQAGKDDAERVARDIRLAGGSCETLRYDACEPADEQLALHADAPTHAYYFATPAIFRPKSGTLAVDLFKEFLAVYVDGFWNLSQSLRARRPNLSIFYPSSVAVTDRPRGMTEYAMAKAAGEVLCTDMNVSLAPMHVTVHRLPRLPTDQTATVTAANSADPVEIMLPIIRNVQSFSPRS